MTSTFQPVAQAWADIAGLEQAYAWATPYGRAALSEQFLFYAGPMHVDYLPLDDIAWGYLRQEHERAKGVWKYTLVVATHTGQKKVFGVDCFADARALLQGLRRAKLLVGYADTTADGAYS